MGSDRVVVWCNGISGSERSEYIRLQQELARANGKDFTILRVYDYLVKTFSQSNLGVEWNNILDMGEQQLKVATYAAYKEINHIIQRNPNTNYVIDGHGKFWWNGVPIYGFHPYFMKTIKPDLCVSIIDSEMDVKERLDKNPQWKRQKLSMQEILRWTADEVNIARLWADFHSMPWHVISRRRSATTLYMLMFEPQRKKIYFAFPMTHAHKDGVTYKMQTQLALRLIKVAAVTDPRGIEQYKFDGEAQQAAFSTFYRDLHWWVTQNQVVFVFYATPVPSIGAASEVLQARFQTKNVYVVWPHKQGYSPFTIAAADHVFHSEKDFLKFFYDEFGPPDKEFVIPKKILDDAYLKGE